MPRLQRSFLIAATATACTVTASAQPGRPTPDVGRGPDPSPVPISWELDFKFLDLRRIDVSVPGSGLETYWYMVYTVTNTSDRAVHFFPLFTIVTEDLKTIKSDMGIHPLVFEAIQERHRQTHPYLLTPTRAIGNLRSGEDNARESVAIWRQLDLRVNNFSVYVAGLSGEKRFVPNPGYNPARPESPPAPDETPEHQVQPDAKDDERPANNGEARESEAQRSREKPGRSAEKDSASSEPANRRYFTLRKTLEIQYTLPGSPHTREMGEPQRLRMRWIMR